MAIDASIAAGQPAQNILQSLAGATAVKGQMLQQNQLTQQMAANKATSAAMQQAYDPATGRVDTNKLAAIMSQDPAAAYNLLPTQNAILENQQKQVGIDTANFDLGLKRNNYFVNQFAGLASKPNPTPDDVLQVAVGAVKQGLLPPDEVVRQLQNAPKDPAQIQAWAQQNLRQSMINASQYAGVLPQNSFQDLGGQKVAVSVDPMTGKVTPMAQLNNTMSPGDAATPVPVFNPSTGAMELVSKAQFAGGAAPGAAQVPTGGGEGRYPGASASPPLNQPRTFQSGPSLGQAAAAETVGKGAGEGVLSLQNQAEGSPQRVYFLQDMLANLPKFDSGPTADWTAKANALALQLAPGMAARMGVDPQSVASKEEFAKFATNLAINSSSGLGAGTDSKLAAAVAGNPNASLSKLGNEQIMKVLIGTERATQAKNEAWQNAGVGPEQYGKWSAQWNKDIDPRVFVTPELTQEERSKMYNGLKPADQKRFLDSYRTAVDSGLIQRPPK